MTDSMDPKAQISADFEALAKQAIADRGPSEVKAKRGKARLLKTDTGKTVTHGQVLQGLLTKAEIEAAVIDGRRPPVVFCEKCNTLVKASCRGPIPRLCAACRKHEWRAERQRSGGCVACGAPTTARRCEVHAKEHAQQQLERHRKQRDDARRVMRILCTECGAPVPTPVSGRTPTRCQAHRRHRDTERGKQQHREAERRRYARRTARPTPP